MLKKVLIANRGEIAHRIQCACQSLGVSSVCVASEADREAYFARAAQELVIIGPAPAGQSYLDAERLIAAALETSCDSVHPGYGFLSENTDFARAVETAGLTWIGPSAQSIELMGSKTAARECVSQAGVPCAPGVEGGLSDKELRSAAIEIGFPVLLKAVAGGGGRGMKVAYSAEEFDELLPRARAEAQKFFANDDVFVEKYIEQPRHVEVQVFGDKKGKIIHLGTRECSVQRRHQKLIEEAPAPFLSKEVRDRVHRAAIDAAKSVNYYNAGTVEFLVAGEEIYFLEMNTRIQVEHPVTELVTGLDLVALQIRIAGGEKLPISQKDVSFTGHAIEYRINAEDATKGFTPATGKIEQIVRPKASFVREDYGYESGDEVSAYYDGMLSKLIVYGESREQALTRSAHVLFQYRIAGLPTTLPFHRWLLDDQRFSDSGVDIGFVEREFRPEEIQDFVDPMDGSQSTEAVCPVELYSYWSQKYQYQYRVEILQSSCGVFVATPLAENYTRASMKYRRSSYTRDGAANVLIAEVLEEADPDLLFAH